MNPIPAIPTRCTRFAWSALTALGLCAAVGPAQAELITVASVNTTVTWTLTPNVFLRESFNFNGLEVRFGFSGNAGNSDTPRIFRNNVLGVSADNFLVASRLAAGTTIGASTNWQQNADMFLEGGSSSAWDTTSSVEGYIGLYVPAAGGGLSYGYAHFRYDDAGNSLTLLDYAYETTGGKSVVIPQAVTTTATTPSVPEPGTAALALLAALGVAGTARRAKR